MSAEDPWADYDAQMAESAVSPEPERLSFAFYGRCSTEDNQDPETSRQWQLRVAKNMLAVAAPGASITAEFFDVGQSRSLPWKRRREAQRMLAELDDPRRTWNAIVVGEGQRCWFGSQFAEVAPVIEHRGVTLYVPELSGAYDPANPAHYSMMTLTGGMSRAERQRVQDRTRQGMAAQVEQQGRYQGGRPPYGYVAVGDGPHPNPRKAAEGFQLKKLDLDPAAAPIVKRIFAEVIEGRSIREIAVGLNRDKIACPSEHDQRRNRHRVGDGWQPGTVRSILDNQRYTGFEQWGKFRKDEVLLNSDDPSWGHRTRLVRNENAPVRSRKQAHPAIVSVDVWQRAQQTLKARSAGGLAAMSKRPRAAIRKTRRSYALRGVVVCASCERKMWAERYGKGEGIRFRCRRKDLVEGSPKWEGHPDLVSVNQSPMLERLSGWLGQLLSPDQRERTLDALTVGLDVPNIADLRREQTNSRVQEAEKRLQNLLDAVEAGVDPAIMAPRINAAQQEVDALKASVPLTVEAPPITRDDLAALVDEFADAADEVFGPEADQKDLNDFFQAIGLKVTVDKPANRIVAEVQFSAQEAANPHDQPENRSVGVNVRVRRGT